MSESLFSSSWYRVATIRPRVRSHVQVHRHVYRGEVWYILQDHSTGRFHRFSPVANLVIGLMNGRRTLGEIWHIACERLGDDAPTQDEVINLLSSLHQADAMQSDAPPDMEEIHERKQRHDQLRLKQYFMNPLALRFPLFDPERLLAWMSPVTNHLFGPLGVVLWLVVVGWALLLMGTHWTELMRDAGDRLLSAQNLLLIGLVFPVAKAIHEFGHAAAVKAGGGEVHEMGVMLLVLMPIPYVDASAASAFRSKRKRMLVGGAGMLTEIFVAALAMFVWVNVEPGLVRAVAYNVMMVAGVTTLVFNANPLLRFDGYYIFTDYLEMPNLGQRANEYVGYLVNYYLFSMKDAVPKARTLGERAWFVGFAVASFIYRIIIMFSIVVIVAGKYFVIGVLFALWAVYSSLVQPVVKKAAYLLTGPELSGKRARALAVTVMLGAAIAAIVLWLPAPAWTRAEGVAVAPVNSQVRALTDGFVQKILVAPDARVKKGDPLIVNEDPELTNQVRVLTAQVAEQEARYTALRNDRVQSKMIREEIEHLQQRLDTARHRERDLVVLSPRDGTFVMADYRDTPGRFVRRGELLAYVMEFDQIAIQVVVPQGEVDLVNKMTRRVELRPVESLAEVLVATVTRALPGATDKLPNLALSSQGGGEVAMDPTAAAESGRAGDTKTASTLFIFELKLESGVRLGTLGSRIYVRFEREPESLGAQWYRSARRIFLNKFNV